MSAPGASPYTPLGAEDDAPSALAKPARRGRLGGKQQAAQPSRMRPDELGASHTILPTPGRKCMLDCMMHTAGGQHTKRCTWVLMRHTACSSQLIDGEHVLCSTVMSSTC